MTTDLDTSPVCDLRMWFEWESSQIALDAALFTDSWRHLAHVASNMDRQLELDLGGVPKHREWEVVTP